MHHGSLRTFLGRPLPRLSPDRAVGPYGECHPGSPTDLQKLSRARWRRYTFIEPLLNELEPSSAAIISAVGMEPQTSGTAGGRP
jgi:hypothetical protein